MQKSSQSLVLASLVTIFLPQLCRAAVGNDNPLGPTGEYNGSITTAGSYDPYTGNAKRFVDDLVVTGGLGAYPLKWTRVLNTRNPGAWAHSYKWTLQETPYEYYHYYPELYEGPGAVLGYPDGRTLTFGKAQAPFEFGEDSGGAEPQDRLVHRGTGQTFDLFMRDGGIVRFDYPLQAGHSYTLIAFQIIDPYGLVTNLEYDGSRRLIRVTEPGGRYLQISYTNSWAQNVASVQAFSAPGQPATETVTYSYDGNNITHAYYDDNTFATYTYVASNSGEIGGTVIKTCDDPRFAGPMKKIEYEYVTDPHYNPAHGQIKKEKNATTHQTVSEVIYPLGSSNAVTLADAQRTEVGVTVRAAFSNTPSLPTQSYKVTLISRVNPRSSDVRQYSWVLPF
jgi:YD repeat-containing protein